MRSGASRGMSHAMRDGVAAWHVATPGNGWRSSTSAAYIRARPRPRGPCLCVSPCGTFWKEPGWVLGVAALRSRWRTRPPALNVASMFCVCVCAFLGGVLGSGTFSLRLHPSRLCCLSPPFLPLYVCFRGRLARRRSGIHTSLAWWLRLGPSPDQCRARAMIWPTRPTY